MLAIFEYILTGFAPSLVLLLFGVKAIKINTSESWNDRFDIEQFLGWIMPGVAVLSVIPIQKTTSLIVQIPLVFVWLCVFRMITYVHSYMRWKHIKSGLFSTRHYVVAYFWYLGDIAIVCAILMLLTKYIPKTFSMIPGVSLYMVITLSVYLGGHIFRHENNTTVYGKPILLAPCELSRRIGEIADKMRIEIKSVYIGANKEYGFAGACALSSKRILLTEELIRKCSKDEVDSVIAHELAHAADPYLWWLYIPVCALLWLALCAIAAVIWNAIYQLPAQFFFIHYVLWTALFLLPKLVYMRLNRYQERNADTAILALDKPEACISCRYKLGLINQTSLDCAPWARILQSHPTFNELTADIMKQSKITNDDLIKIKQQAEDELADDSCDHYEPVFYEPKQTERIPYPNLKEYKIQVKYLIIFITMIFCGFLTFQYEPSHTNPNLLHTIICAIAYIGTVLLICKVYSRKTHAEFRNYYLKVEEKIKNNHQSIDIKSIMVEMLDMIHLATHEWQPAFLIFKDDHILATGEIDLVSINMDSICNITTDFIKHGSLQLSTVTIEYKIGGLSQWLFLKTPFTRIAGNPKNSRELIRYIKSFLNESVIRFTNIRVARSQINVVVGRAAFALLLICLIGCFTWLNGVILHWKIPAILYLIVASFFIKPLYNWSRVPIAK